MERMFYWVSVAHGLRYVALRYFNACGAHMSGKIGEAHNPETHLIPIDPAGARTASATDVSIFGDDYPTKRRHLRARLHPRHRPGLMRTSWLRNT